MVCVLGVGGKVSGFLVRSTLILRVVQPCFGANGVTK